jgi:hypothetical protein
MGSSDCDICGENDYLKEYSLDDMNKNIYVCRTCIEEGLRLRMKQVQDEFDTQRTRCSIRKHKRSRS